MIAIFVMILVFTITVLEIDYWWLRSSGEHKELYKRMWLLHPLNAVSVTVTVYLGYAIAAPVVLLITLITGLRFGWIHAILVSILISALSVGGVFLILSYLGTIGYSVNNHIQSLL